MDKFKAKLDEWAKDKASEADLERARKEFWLGNLKAVTEIAEAAGPGAIEELRRKNDQRLEAGRTVINIYMLDGIAFYQQNKYGDALRAFKVIENLFTTRQPEKLVKEEFIEEWAKVKLWLGNTKSAQGQRGKGREGSLFLSEATNYFNDALTVFTPEQSPDGWERAQMGLGRVLITQGERAGGQAGIKLLAQAATVYAQILKVFTFKKSPMAQLELGEVLTKQGDMVGGEAGLKLLAQAVTVK